MKLNSEHYPSSFRGMNLGKLSQNLYTFTSNDMLNASFIDIFAMDTPRTIVEFNNRGKQAGIEMAFREYTGTFIAEFSAICLALLASAGFAKIYKPEIKINHHSWLTNNAIDTFSLTFQGKAKVLNIGCRIFH